MSQRGKFNNAELDPPTDTSPDPHIVTPSGGAPQGVPPASTGVIGNNPCTPIDGSPVQQVPANQMAGSQLSDEHISNALSADGAIPNIFSGSHNLNHMIKVMVDHFAEENPEFFEIKEPMIPPDDPPEEVEEQPQSVEEEKPKLVYRKTGTTVMDTCYRDQFGNGYPPQLYRPTDTQMQKTHRMYIDKIVSMDPQEIRDVRMFLFKQEKEYLDNAALDIQRAQIECIEHFNGQSELYKAIYQSQQFDIAERTFGDYHDKMIAQAYINFNIKYCLPPEKWYGTPYIKSENAKAERYDFEQTEGGKIVGFKALRFQVNGSQLLTIADGQTCISNIRTGKGVRIVGDMEMLDMLRVEALNAWAYTPKHKGKIDKKKILLIFELRHNLLCAFNPWKGKGVYVSTAGDGFIDLDGSVLKYKNGESMNLEKMLTSTTISDPRVIFQFKRRYQSQAEKL